MATRLCSSLPSGASISPLLRRDVAVDDGQIFFFDGAAFENFSQLAGGRGIFCDDDHAAGFAVEAVDEMGHGC